MLMLRTAIMRLLGWWRGLSLAMQFGIVAAAVVACSMVVIGAWVSDRIQRGVVQNTGISAALYMDNVVEPLVQELAYGGTLSEHARRRIDQLLQQPSFKSRIVSIKIWSADGTVIHGSNSAIIGRKFPISPPLVGAFAGRIETEFDELRDEENELERQLNIPLMEIYAPLRETGSRRVIAVAEFYEVADLLQREMRRARSQSWLIVGGLTLALLGSLIGIVLKGSRLIEQQRASLEGRVGQLSQLLSRNEELSQTLADSGRRAAETNDRFLRRIGADLHDGPAQLIGLALLRLDSLRPGATAPPRPNEFETLRDALAVSLKEIRDISAGLALPELDAVSPAEAVQMAIRHHERRTGHQVRRGKIELPDKIDPMLKASLYRFTQEGLNNAHRHSGGREATVTAHCEHGQLTIQVLDDGFGLAPELRPFESGLGLAGLRDRFESLGGALTLTARPAGGAALTAVLTLSDQDVHNG